MFCTGASASAVHFGQLACDAARGVQLRHDHGSCFMAEDFQTQIISASGRGDLPGAPAFQVVMSVRVLKSLK
jgi:hypothetical protein